ncbi:potassium transporter Kup [Solilutibacter silvestris]|uniref:Probable potassium transport system protein Kup n=1 Tax=Solilutibacter silvestris TaxID=1645665 RepID=A0A2K1Q2S1_9GAMM|nr:potassium transporter Kup [Lysobacter silvestris]PNS09350.1 K+ transporter [Lysobacter silvestris]
MNASTNEHGSSQQAHGHGGALAALAVSALGVVFGDIGTSPLYTVQEAFTPHYQLSVNHDTVLGLLSLIIWTIVFVVTVKYVAIIMRADNEGEGGIMALMALTQGALAKKMPKLMYWMGILGILGAALFFGDSVLTPAQTTLSAVEGLQVVTPAFSHTIVPVSLVILVGLFIGQRLGTARVGRVFGPVMVVWFVAIAAIGIWNIRLAPEVLKSLNPWWGLKFFLDHGVAGLTILGAVVLAVTGGEALYADMGHFGVKPIRTAWYFVVQPCLILNYMGQGALVLVRPAAIGNPFYESVPKPLLIPMVILAMLAAIIASQAVITGAFSMARSAMQLGYIPRMQIRHTSRDTIGQIYVPAINWTLLVLVIAVVIGFGSATRLATAYGVSVTGTMLMTSILMIVYLHNTQKIPALLFWPLAAIFVLVDVAFLGANLAKFMDGAWFPLLLGLIIFTMMRTWRRGRELLRSEMQKDGIQLDAFLPGLMLAPPVRVEGTAIFLTADKTMVPHAFLHNLKHNRVLHARNIFLTVTTLTVPVAPQGQRLSVQAIGDEFYRVVVRFGFMETPDVPRALMELSDCSQMCLDPMDTTYFASRERIVAVRRHGMPIWRDKLFAFMMRNAAPASDFFNIPGNRLVELGTQVQI